MSALPFPPSDPRASIVNLLTEARDRTMLLVDGLSDEDLHRQHDALMSPILWDLGHIAHFEELWLTQNLDGTIECWEMPGIYNPFEPPRAERRKHPLPAIQTQREKLGESPERVLTRLSRVDLDDSNPLLSGGYVYHMVLQHEYQHNETILQTLQLKLGEPYHPPVRVPVPEIIIDQSELTDMVRIPAGEYSIGTDDRLVAYDNERPRHRVEVSSFRIDRAPVTNGDYMEFMNAGGYRDVRLWTDAGWEWVSQSGAAAPAYWTRDGDTWLVRTMDRTGAVDERRPVGHVSEHAASG